MSSKKDKLLQKYLDKKRKQKKRDDLLAQIYEIERNKSNSSKAESVDKKYERVENGSDEDNEIRNGSGDNKDDGQSASCLEDHSEDECVDDCITSADNNTMENKLGNNTKYVQSDIQPKFVNSILHTSAMNNDGFTELNSRLHNDLIEDELAKPLTNQDKYIECIQNDDKNNILTDSSCDEDFLENEIEYKEIRVNRNDEIENERKNLPIYYEQEEITHVLKHNTVIFVQGETGCGKSTQIPQFLYEKCNTGKMIGITQPRRIAAINLATRINTELSTNVCGYHIRYENNICDKTQIKVMTDGILLREIQEDFLLTKYSVIILDEVHERSINMDILIVLLSKIIKLRKDLKIVLMTACKMNKIYSHFGESIKICVDANIHKVKVFYEDKNPEDYVISAFDRIKKTLRSMEGYGSTGIVYDKMARGMKDSAPYESAAINIIGEGRDDKTRNHNTVTTDCGIYQMRDLDGEIYTEDYSTKNNESNNSKREYSKHGLESMSLRGDRSAHIHKNKKIRRDENTKYGMSPVPNTILVFLPSINDINRLKNLLDETLDGCTVLPLHSKLSRNEQDLVYARTDDCKIILATNIAETSITIPDVYYVIDTGLVKSKYVRNTGMTEYMISYISKSSAQQRAGRAGRVMPGICYRLYTGYTYSNFEEESLPKILYEPITKVLLDLMCLGIRDIRSFPFIDKPSDDVFDMAINELKRLSLCNDNLEITKLGRNISFLPCSPRVLKLLCISNTSHLLTELIDLVCLITSELEVNKKYAKEYFCNEKSDLIVMLKIYRHFELSKNKKEFCKNINASINTFIEIKKMGEYIRKKLNIKDARQNELDLHTTNQLRNVIYKVYKDRVCMVYDKSYWYRNSPVSVSKNSIETHGMPVVFEGLIKGNKRVYMNNVTVLDTAWI